MGSESDFQSALESDPAERSILARIERLESGSAPASTVDIIEKANSGCRVPGMTDDQVAALLEALAKPARESQALIDAAQQEVLESLGWVPNQRGRQ